MSGMKRKVMYLGLMPFLFCINIMINFMGLNTTIPLALVVIFMIILRISDRGTRFYRLNEWTKRRMVRFFPDIYQTGILPNGRFLLAVVPIILAMLLNIPISNVR